MQHNHERVEPGMFAMRSLFLPAAASALLAFGLGMGFPCESAAGGWAMIGAPAFAAIGAVGGPERNMRARLGVGLLSAVINLFIMVAIGLATAWTSCSY